MVTLECGLGPPSKTWEQMKKEQEWQEFYQDIQNKGEALGRIIYVVEELLNSNEKNIFMDFEETIPNLDLARYLEKYLIEQTPRDLKNPSERNNFMEKTAKNLLSELKTIKKEGNQMSIPYKNRKSAEKFLKMFESTPIKIPGTTYSL